MLRQVVGVAVDFICLSIALGSLLETIRLSDFRRLACVGSGVVGSSWALQFAMKRHDVVLYDLNERILRNAIRDIKLSLNVLIENGVPDLPLIAGAGYAIALLLGPAEGRQQNRDQQGDNPNDHKEFDQRKCSAP